MSQESFRHDSLLQILGSRYKLCRAALSSTSRFLNHSRDTGITVAMNAPSTPQNSSATLDRPHSRSAHSPPETPRSSAAPALPARVGYPIAGHAGWAHHSKIGHFSKHSSPPLSHHRISGERHHHDSFYQFKGLLLLRCNYP